MLDYSPELIADALDEFRAAESVSPQSPVGAAQVRATVAHRRRVKAATLSVLGALLIALPIAAFAAHPRGNNPPPPGGESATPAPNPGPTDSPSPSPAPAPLAADAKFTVEQLTAANAVVPGTWAGECAAKIGPKPAQYKAASVFVERVVHTNLDSDPALETAAWVTCYLDDARLDMVVAYDSDGTGMPTPLGIVVPSLKPNDIIGLKEREGGGVVVNVSFSEESPEPGEPAPQLREFAWNGTVFKQVGGPTSFPPPIRLDLSISASELNLGPVVDGKRTGSMSVTLKNKGSTASPRLEVSFALNGLVVIGDLGGNMAHWPALQAGETRTYQVQVTVPAENTRSTFEITIFTYIADPVYDNNHVEVAINRA